MKSIKMQVRLDDFTYNELKKVKEELNIGISDFVRRAIFEKLQRIENAKIMPVDKRKH